MKFFCVFLAFFLQHCTFFLAHFCKEKHCLLAPIIPSLIKFESIFFHWFIWSTRSGRHWWFVVSLIFCFCCVFQWTELFWFSFVHTRFIYCVAFVLVCCIPTTVLSYSINHQWTFKFQTINQFSNCNFLSKLTKTEFDALQRDDKSVEQWYIFTFTKHFESWCQHQYCRCVFIQTLWFRDSNLVRTGNKYGGFTWMPISDADNLILLVDIICI